MWHGDGVQSSDVAQGQPSLRVELHKCHIVIVAKSTCAKFVVVFKN